MPHLSSDPPRGARLRLVFGDAEVRFDLGAAATLEDVALKLADPTVRGRGRPLSVLVDLAGAPRHDA